MKNIDLDIPMMQQERMDWIHNSMIDAALRDRTIWIRNEINADTSYFVNRMIDKIIKLDSTVGKGFPITFKIDSEGGSIFDGLSIISRIEELKEYGYPIQTHVTGISMSMACVIAMAGTKGMRTAHRYARFMIHSPSSLNFGMMEIEDEISKVEESKEIWLKLRDTISGYSNITDMFMVNELQIPKKNFYFWPEKAVELGVIDSISKSAG